MPIIPGFGRLKKEDHCKFKASLGYIMKFYFFLNKPKPKAMVILSHRQAGYIIEEAKEEYQILSGPTTNRNSVINLNIF